jgi:hypothetical protein
MNRIATGIVSPSSRRFVTLPLLTLATVALPLAVPAPEARAQSNPWGTPSQQTPVQTTPWGGGGGSGGGGYRQPGNRTLSFPVQGVICDSSVNVCFNAGGAALAETEQEFGRRARRTLENNLLNNPIVDVTFADGRYCNFNLRGCWTNRQRTSFDPRLNPWVFGAGPGAPGGQGTVIGGSGSTWGPGAGNSTGQPPGNSFRAPFTRTRQSGTCAWTNAGISIYNGTCRYEIVQNNANGSKTLAFTFDRLPASNPLRTLRFTAQGNGPWSIQMPNGTAAAVQSTVNADQYRSDIRMGWAGVFNLGFQSTTTATTAQLNQALQPVDANGQVMQGSDSEALGQALGGLLQQLFGGGR